MCVMFGALSGALAQLGERLLCKHQVIGSIPIGSTTAQTARARAKARSHVGERGRASAASFDDAALPRRPTLLKISRDEDTRSPRNARCTGPYAALFDIVNGFLKSMP